MYNTWSGISKILIMEITETLTQLRHLKTLPTTHIEREGDRGSRGRPKAALAGRTGYDTVLS